MQIIGLSECTEVQKYAKRYNRILSMSWHVSSGLLFQTFIKVALTS